MSQPAACRSRSSALMAAATSIASSASSWWASLSALSITVIGPASAILIGRAVCALAKRKSSMVAGPRRAILPVMRGTMLAAAVDLFLRLVDEVDAVPGAGHVEDEAFAALLAIGEEIKPDLLLLAQGDDGGIVHGFAQRLALEPERAPVALGAGEPVRAR